MKPTTLKRLSIATVVLVGLGFALTALDRPSRTEASDGEPRGAGESSLASKLRIIWPKPCGVVSVPSDKGSYQDRGR